MLKLDHSTYSRVMAVLAAISIAAWIAFAAFFRLVWPGVGEAGAAVFWSWLVIGGAVALAIAILFFRAFDTPRTMIPSIAVALTAPALCADVVTVTFFESWFPSATAFDDRSYAALILGGVGAILLASLVMGRPDKTDQA